MAALPVQGGSDGTWGTELNDFLTVGHDSDGTFKKSQMLTDMGWSPTTYAGQQSITFPNGLILKAGYKTFAGSVEHTITFDVAFSYLLSAQVTSILDAAVSYNETYIRRCQLDSITVRNPSGASLTGFYWQVWGY